MGEAKVRKMNAMKASIEFNASHEKRVFDSIVEHLQENNPSVKMEIVSSKDLMSGPSYTVFVREICLRGAVIQIRVVSYWIDNGNLVNIENRIVDRIDWFAKNVRDGEIAECRDRVRSQYQAKIPWLWLEKDKTPFYWTSSDKSPYPFDLFAELVELAYRHKNKNVSITKDYLKEIIDKGFGDFLGGRLLIDGMR